MSRRPPRSGFCGLGNPDDSHRRCHLAECACQCHHAAEPDMVTPTGVLVTDAEPATPDWFEARRGGITGTDLPKILGLTKYGNALSVWLDKRGELDDDGESEAARWGNLLEDPVALEWAERNDSLVRRVGVLAHHEHPWMRASLDRLVLPDACPDGDDTCGLEIKTRSAYKADDWKDGIPDDVLAQTAWGLMVTGLHHMHIAALIGGQRLVSFRVDRDQKLEDYLLEAARPVWTAVTEGVPPETHPDAEGVLLGLLDKLYAVRAGERDLPEGARKWVAQYADGGELERRGKKLKTEAKTALVQMVDDGDAGRLDERLVFTYRRPAPGTTLSADSLRALAKEQPDTYAALVSDGYITTTQPGPRFTFKEKSA